MSKIKLCCGDSKFKIEKLAQLKDNEYICRIKIEEL